MKKKILLALFISCCTVAKAQDEVYYRIQIDLLGGVRYNMNTQRNDMNLLWGSGKRTMPAFGLRTTAFFLKHWGMYQDINLYQAGKKDASYYVPSSHFGEGYLVENYVQEEGSGKVIGTTSIGAAYQTKKGRWILQSRLGLGLKLIIVDQVSFDIKNKENGEFYRVKYNNEKLLSGIIHHKLIPTLALGSNVSYQLHKSIWLTGNVNYYHPTSRPSQRYSITNKNTGEVVVREKVKSHDIGNYLDVSVGISFFICKR